MLRTLNALSISYEIQNIGEPCFEGPITQSYDPSLDRAGFKGGVQGSHLGESMNEEYHRFVAISAPLILSTSITKRYARCLGHKENITNDKKKITCKT
jgi:hypothetical protein